MDVQPAFAGSQVLRLQIELLDSHKTVTKSGVEIPQLWIYPVFTGKALGSPGPPQSTAPMRRRLRREWLPELTLICMRP